MSTGCRVRGYRPLAVGWGLVWGGVMRGLEVIGSLALSFFAGLRLSFPLCPFCFFCFFLYLFLFLPLSSLSVIMYFHPHVY